MSKNSRKKSKLRKRRPSPIAHRSSSGALDTQADNSPKIVAQTLSFTGPLPHPEILEKYAEIIPDGADRILKMAESQSLHRQRMESWAVIGGAVLAHVGVVCGLCMGLAALYFAYLVMHEGHVIPGSIIGGGGIVALVGAFIYGTRSRKEERLERNRQNRELIQR